MLLLFYYTSLLLQFQLSLNASSTTNKRPRYIIIMHLPWLWLPGAGFSSCGQWWLLGCGLWVSGHTVTWFFFILWILSDGWGLAPSNLAACQVSEFRPLLAAMHSAPLQMLYAESVTSYWLSK